MNTSQKKKILDVLKMKKCKYCREAKNLTIDHKIPKIQGGSNKISNLQCLCKNCNGIKSNMSDKKVKGLFRWFLKIQESRLKHGAKIYKLK